MNNFLLTIMQRLLAAVALLMALGFSSNAGAFVGCDIAISGVNTQTVAPNTGTTYSVQYVGTTCPATTTLSFTVLSDTTGGVITPAPFVSATGSPQSFAVTAGGTGGGTAVIQVVCGACTGVTTLNVTLNTTNVYTYVATTPTNAVINQLTTASIGTSLAFNSVPVGGTYTMNVLEPPATAPLFSVPFAGGAANATVSSFVAGTFNYSATVLCPVPIPAGCPPAPIPFTVTVEPVTLTPVSPINVNMFASATITMQTRYGGPTTVAPVGDTITWTIAASPPGGNGVISAVTTTNAAGQSQANFTASVPGVYTVAASSGDTFSPDPTETFTITVAAVVRTIAISAGNNQTGPPNTPVPINLAVLVQDNGVNAPGVQINWAVTGGSATLGAASTLSNAAGIATVTASFGPTAGPITITATRNDDTTISATFDLSSALSLLSAVPQLTPEQLQVAQVIDGFCVKLSLLPALTPDQTDLRNRCNELIINAPSNPALIRNILDQLLPGTQSAQAQAAFLTTQGQFSNIQARIAALRSGKQENDFAGLALRSNTGSVPLASVLKAMAGESEQEAGADFDRWGFFASGTIGQGDADANGVSVAYDFDVEDLTFGVDYRKSDRWIFGAAAGYTQQDTELSAARGEGEARGLTLSLYSTYYKNDTWYTDGVLTFGRNNYDALRRIQYSIPALGGGTTVVNQVARSEADGDFFSVGLTFGRDFSRGAWNLGPYGRVLYTRLSTDDSRETLISGTPGSGFGLIVEGRDQSSLASIIGGKLTYTKSTSWGVWMPHVQLEWEHEFQDNADSLIARFINDPNGAPMVLNENDVDGDFIRLGFGMSLLFSKGRSAFFYYEKYFARDGIEQDNLALGLRFEF